MSENTSAQQGGTLAGDSTGDTSGSNQSSGTQDKDFVSKSEFDKVSSANNWAQSEVKKLKNEVESFQSQIAELTKSTKKDSGKGGEERLAQAESRIKELEESLSQSQGEVREFKVEGKVREKAIAAGFLEGAFKDFWKAEGSEFGEEEIEGEKHIRLKTKPYMQLDHYFDELKQNKPWFFGNERKAGTGLPDKSGAKPNESSVAIPKDFHKLSQSEQQEFFSKMSPEERAQLRGQLYQK